MSFSPLKAAQFTTISDRIIWRFSGWLRSLGLTVHPVIKHGMGGGLLGSYLPAGEWPVKPADFKSVKM